MKVYDLMKALSEVPAGKEVKVSAMMSLAEFVGDGDTCEINGVELYKMVQTVKDICLCGENEVVLLL